MWDLNGTVDHFLSTDNHRHLAYEWSNYRYASGWLNSSKRSLDRQVLDPLRVRDEWFEIDVASLHLQLTPAIRARIRPSAEFTLRRLGLDYGPRVIIQRQTYLNLFTSGEIRLSDLDREAPLIGMIVRRERLMAHLSAHTWVPRGDVDQICEAAGERTGELLRIWRSAGRIVAKGRGPIVRYRCA
jgi:hypothetical protein